MSGRQAGQATDLVLEYDLDAPTEKVWRAISIPAFRERWLPDGALADAEPILAAPGEEIRFRMRDREPPHLESVVAFQLRPNEQGGTTLRIVHGLADARAAPRPLNDNGNDNGRTLMRAA
ncbi:MULTISPECIES: SRPBCC family protein [unclassified Shinella]|uniref:SRPBCC family protein n=1 Tax=unclassified Shinella TaxID=2643062 RepID=UPI00234EAF49|nr:MULTISPECIES: polyketide cyclase [unclassified Shinella]MCO5150152.1 polyketide cyclase [Shinella sp.]MDC7261099.1 polyketide cyclase [Shinella sp. HY16]MDC7267994.1 polyketide cyclase [Shinella sp. YZ44]